MMLLIQCLPNSTFGAKNSVFGIKSTYFIVHHSREMYSYR